MLRLLWQKAFFSSNLYSRGKKKKKKKLHEKMYTSSAVNAISAIKMGVLNL